MPTSGNDAPAVVRLERGAHLAIPNGATGDDDGVEVSG